MTCLVLAKKEKEMTILQSSKSKLDFRVLTLATILLIALIVPMNYVHEIGHGIICALEGNQFQIHIGVDNSTLICIGGSQNTELFFVFGGLFASLVCAIPLIKYSWLKKYPWIIIPILTLSIGHGINAIIEVSLTDWYMQNGVMPEITLGMISLMCYFGVLIYFGRTK